MAGGPEAKHMSNLLKPINIQVWLHSVAAHSLQIRANYCQPANNEGERERGGSWRGGGVSRAVAHSRAIFEQKDASGLNPKTVPVLFFVCLLFYRFSHDLFSTDVSLFIWRITARE